MIPIQEGEKPYSDFENKDQRDKSLQANDETIKLLNHK